MSQGKVPISEAAMHIVGGVVTSMLESPLFTTVVLVAFPRDEKGALMCTPAVGGRYDEFVVRSLRKIADDIEAGRIPGMPRPN